MKIVVEVSPDGLGHYRASCPALPGCTVHADSREEAREKIVQSVRGYLASMNVALPADFSRMVQIA